MIESDTIKLLRECDAGIKMGTDSIESVIGKVHSPELRSHLDRCRDEHERFGSEVEMLLGKYGDEGKDPNIMAKTMSDVKTGATLLFDPTDNAIADIMTDGCNMGVKSLSRYLNQYEAADESSKDLAKRLISSELRLVENVRAFL